MSSTFINGAKYAVSTSLAAAAVVSAISNADPAVASATVVPAEGDILVLQSGWTELNETVVRADAVTAGSFTLEGVDTSDAVRFPAGEGGGAYQTVGGFVGISQVRDVVVSGGDQNYFNYQYVEDQSGRQRQKPTFKGPTNIALTMDYDPSLGWHDTLVELDRLREAVVLRETLPTGDVIYYYGEIAYNKVPTKAINENMTVSATFSLLSDPVRFAGV